MTSPRVLIVGSDTHGSWQVRGLQLGHAIGARVTTQPKMSDFAWAEVIVLVKRAIAEWGATAQRTRLPIVWDVLDFWKQPDENHLSVEDARQRVLDLRDQYGVSTLIGATEAMADAIGGVYLAHHSRPGLSPALVRKAQTIVVGYEGHAKYLGSWKRTLEHACARLGMVFVVNPSDLRALDVVVAFRGEQWDGEICRQWKSGVKYVNAIAAGRPVLTQATEAFSEIDGCGVAIQRPDEVVDALSALAGESLREAAYETGRRLAQSYHLEAMAARYRSLVGTAMRVAA